MKLKSPNHVRYRLRIGLWRNYYVQLVPKLSPSTSNWQVQLFSIQADHQWYRFVTAISSMAVLSAHYRKRPRFNCTEHCFAQQFWQSIFGQIVHAHFVVGRIFHGLLQSGKGFMYVLQCRQISFGTSLNRNFHYACHRCPRHKIWHVDRLAELSSVRKWHAVIGSIGEYLPSDFHPQRA